MNTSNLKSFAPDVRRQLLEAVERKLDYVLTADSPDLRQAAEQVKALKQKAEQHRHSLVEGVAYTWFNRLAALRFLDAQGWHPFKVRVLTPATAEETQPELLKLFRSGSLPQELCSHTDVARLNDLLDGRIPSADAQGEVYRHLVLAACRFYHALLPNIFERLNGETELLLPDDLLTEHSVVHGFRTEISDEDCKETDENGKTRANVEILGWLYQFYISEKKDAVMARKSAVPTEDIPAVTQLFTPHWIVRYLVENSLGRLWLLNRPNSRLREHMPYYIEGEPETDFLKITTPEEIKVCDPAVGSAHMLTYAFDLLTLIYEEEGYAPSEIPALILRHNLHGLDICPRAAQLAELALVFKAREKSRRFFQPEHLVRPQIIELRDVHFAENELRDYIDALGVGNLFNQPVIKLLHQFEDAKNFGSLIQPCLDERIIEDIRSAIEAKDLSGELLLRGTHLKVLRVLAQAEALTQRYHAVVANPPYMGAKYFNLKLKSFVGATLPQGKADSYGGFMVRNLALAVSHGFVAMVTIPNWMFLSSFEDLRAHLLDVAGVASLVHNGRGVWGSDFGSCSFVIRRGWQDSARGVFKRLFVRHGDVATNEELISRFFSPDWPNYQAASTDFRKIPGAPITYWLSRNFIALFDHEKIGAVAEVKAGLTTGNTERHLRYWWEICLSKILRSEEAVTLPLQDGFEYLPYNKGGGFRKWYGNREYVLRFSCEAYAQMQTEEGFRADGISYFLRPSLTWAKITMGDFSCRYTPPGSGFDATATSVFAEENQLGEIGLLLNSIVGLRILNAINSTIVYLPRDVKNTPSLSIPRLAPCLADLVSIARSDWDNFETSWEFLGQPLLRQGLKGVTLDTSWQNWEAHCTAAIRRMQELETENNRLFISAYGLEEELQPEVPEDQITLARADARRDMAAFFSYAVGCMMGRYSLDKPGLILANAGDTLREFTERVQKPITELTFAPDEDGIIPVLDDEWFEDDVVARTRDFLRATFGEEALDANVRFLEASLGKELRKYFLSDFYKDHLQTYKKRPIYWMVSSPKGSFQALFYLHRYNRDTVNTLLNKYLREFIHKLDARINQLAHTEATTINAREKTAARKESEKLRKSLKECQDWERDVVLPFAQQRIPLDLDDGVKVNYLKFPGLLAKIPGLEKKED